MPNPQQWLGVKYPDSDFVGLLFRYAKPRSQSPYAIDVGCGPGRHLAVLNDLGYSAIGIDNDPRMCQQAQANGFNVRCVDARDYKPDQPLALTVCWGFVMLLDDAPDLIASWQADLVIVDWRTLGNSCLQWKGNQQVGERRYRLDNPGHVLHEQVYIFHDLDHCQIPRYDRIHWQRVARYANDELNEWFQTVHKRR